MTAEAFLAAWPGSSLSDEEFDDFERVMREQREQELRAQSEEADREEAVVDGKPGDE